MEMDESANFLSTFLVEDCLGFEEPAGRKKKRSSILKQTKCVSSEITELCDVESKKGQRQKRVSFANRFQVMEMNTGNIYDIPGKNETSKDLSHSQNITGAESDKENLGISFINKYSASLPDISSSSDFPLQLGKGITEKGIPAKDQQENLFPYYKSQTSLLETSSASDNMELTQLTTQLDTTSIFPSPSPDTPRCIAQLPTDHSTYGRVGSLSNDLVSSTENNQFFRKQKACSRNSTLPDMEVTCAVTPEESPEKALFPQELQDKIISESKVLNPSLSTKTGIFEDLDFTCLSSNTGLLNARRSEVILSSSMLRKRLSDDVSESDSNVCSPLNEGIEPFAEKGECRFEENSLKFDSFSNKGGPSSKKLMKLVIDNPLNEVQPVSYAEKPVYSFTRNPLGEVNHKAVKDNCLVLDSPFKPNNPCMSFMDMTCISPKQDIENTEGNIRKHTLLDNTPGVEFHEMFAATDKDDSINLFRTANLLNKMCDPPKKCIEKEPTYNDVYNAKQSRKCDSNFPGLNFAVKSNIDKDLTLDYPEHKKIASTKSIGTTEQINSTNFLDFTCTVNTSLDECSQNFTEHIKNICPTTSENNVEQSQRGESDFMEFTCAVSGNISESFVNGASADLNNSCFTDIYEDKKLPQIRHSNVMELTCAVNGNIDQSFVKEASEELNNSCYTDIYESKQLPQINQSNFMEITCTVNTSEENEISLNVSKASNNSLNEDFEHDHQKQNLVHYETERDKEDGKGKSLLKRSCTSNDGDDIDSFMVKRTKSHTPAIVYRMRKTKVITEEVQNEIYLTPELEKAINHGDIFRSNNDASIFSPGNLNAEKSSSLLKQKVLYQKMNESELFSTKMLLSNVKTIQGSPVISFETSQYNQGDSNKLATVTSDAVSSDISPLIASKSQMSDLPGEIKGMTPVKPSIELLSPQCKKFNLSLETLLEQRPVSPFHEVEFIPKDKHAATNELTPKLNNSVINTFASFKQTSTNSLSEEIPSNPKDSVPNCSETIQKNKHEKVISSVPTSLFDVIQSSGNLPIINCPKSGSETFCIPDQTKSDTLMNASCMGNNAMKKVKMDSSILDQTKDIHKNMKNLSYLSRVTSFNQTGGECTANESYSFQLLPNSLLNNSISLCGTGIEKEELNSFTKVSPDFSFSIKEPKAFSDSKTIVDISRDCLLPEKKIDAIPMNNSCHNKDLPDVSPNQDAALTSDIKNSTDPLSSIESVEEEADRSKVINSDNIERSCENVNSSEPLSSIKCFEEEMNQSNVETIEKIDMPSEDKKMNKASSNEPLCTIEGVNTEMNQSSVITSGIIDKPCEVMSKNEVCHPPICNEARTVVKDSFSNSTFEDQNIKNNATSIDNNLSGVASSQSSNEPDKNSLPACKKLIEEASGAKKRWFLVSMKENRAVIQLNWRCFLFWCRLRIQIDQISSTESNISFSYKSTGEEIEDFGYKCFLYFVPKESVSFPICSDWIITKITEYADMARRVEALMSDVMQLILFFETTTSVNCNPLKITTEVLNDNLVSKFSLTFEVDFYSYPQKKITPVVQHLVLKNVNEKIQEAVAKVEPGSSYLYRMAQAAKNL